MADGYYRNYLFNSVNSQLVPRSYKPNVVIVTNSKQQDVNFQEISSSVASYIDLTTLQDVTNMYNQNQYPSQNYTSSYPSYQQAYNYSYQGYGQYPTPTSEGHPPGEEYPNTNWAPVQGYTNPTQIPPPGLQNREEAVAHELKQQKSQLVKQREDYVRKVIVLRREQELLRNQKQELLTQQSPPHDVEAIIKENEKLQDEIQGKIKAIQNVIEMLSTIIKDGLKMVDLEIQLQESNSPKTQPRKSVVPTKTSEKGDDTKYNYVHYDPELHWCRMCDKFPKTAKELLLHLQTKKHKDKVQENDVGDNTPWHKLPQEPELPQYENAPKKRVPIKGLQFFISAPSWYCKLCDIWIGDLHCASLHLKSQTHCQNYDNFVEQNPHWEIEWLNDREKCQARCENNDSSDSEDTNKKKKKRHEKKEKESKEKKKKKRSKRHKKQSSDSSSSSSSSDSSSDEDTNKSRSIRVAMRNIKVQNIMNEDLTDKWEMLGRLVEEHKKKEEEINQKSIPRTEDNLINQWMTVSQPQDTEKVLLDNLKGRMKQKQEAERVKVAELQRKKLEREKEEHEIKEKKEKQERERKERVERELKEKEMEEFNRIRDSARNQVKFKTSRDRFRRRRKSAESDEGREPPKRSPEVRDRDRDRERHYRRRSPERHRRDNHENGRSFRERSKHRSRSKSVDRNYKQEKHERQEKQDKQEKQEVDEPKTLNAVKKPPGPPSYKKLPFIGRMPLFKIKKPDEKVEKEIKKEEYEIPRQSRFQPGNLARAFIPEPEVVCFPRLTTIPPLVTPPAPTVTVRPPAPPKITEALPKVPPAPKIVSPMEEAMNIQQYSEDFNLYHDTGSVIMNDYYPPNMDFTSMYPQMLDFSQTQDEDKMTNTPHSHTMPLQPPPLPPAEDADDLALLGISADDMAAQSF